MDKIKNHHTMKNFIATPDATLYCQATFSKPNPSVSQRKEMEKAAHSIGNSGFTTVILGQFHVHQDGDIYYNDSELSTVLDALQNIPQIIKSYGIVKNVLLTFGPFAADFANIQSNFNYFKKTMDQLVVGSSIDGLDWDIEQNLQSFSSLIVDLNIWITGLGKITTAAPYYDTKFWIGVQERSSAHQAGFSWWNLQLYGGAVYDSWVNSLKDIVPDPAQFLHPGFACTMDSRPPSIMDALINYKRTYPGLIGGFLWKYEAIPGTNYSISDYAKSILGGVSG